ncbi:MAG: hypothetical protein IPL65_11785 [Lewinellaceae bacterium]|nr:hypothetical protein [Lewinellaceae bacterium]
MQIKIAIVFALIGQSLSAQSLFQELPALPQAVSNNAVCAVTIDSTTYLYSFCGIDSTRLWSGIQLNSWRFTMPNGPWEAMPPVPDPDGGKIAAAASTVKNIIYLIGGYHVAQNGNETSSNKVHRFNPATNSWLADGTPLPIPIDDHVQAVWRDSLIYVVTGWSNTGNVPNVQIYNPSEDVWLTGAPVPNNTIYKVFGASGWIRGDTFTTAVAPDPEPIFPSPVICAKATFTQITLRKSTGLTAVAPLPKVTAWPPAKSPTMWFGWAAPTSPTITTASPTTAAGPLHHKPG